ncbi:restriction endonuclease subunit S [Lactococcus lactis]|uniref:restriction endonuclease subunit S n=1 Tax=Lactococcus lactis TaxID=1358 RepID=UPI003D14D460
MSKKSPQLRFEGFTDDWEERKIKDIFKITRGHVLAATETSEEKSDISPFPVYSSQTKNNGLMGYYKDYLFDTAITWTTDGANAGTVSYRSGRFYSTNVNGVLISDKGYTNKAISEILNLEAWKWVSHVGNPKLMNNVMGDISIMIPSSFEEQDRLSDFLNQLDDTIALHQRKLDLLKEQKKGYLQKMFPKNGEKVPELRFAGFADDWEERKLGEIGSFKNGMNFGKDAMGHGSPFVNLQNIFGKNIVDDTTLELAESTEKQKVEYSLIKGDVLFIRSSVKPSGVGEAALVDSNLPDTTYSGFIIRFRPKIDIDNNFKRFAFGTKYVRNQIMARATSSANTNINQDSLSLIQVGLPNLKEQEKIGSFFKQLDETIALHQRKLDLLKEQKKGFLQKMFV